MDKNNLYSRQIGTIGTDTMNKLSNLTVYILDLDTVGLEAAKCLCLLGIKKLYVRDIRKIDNSVRSTNYGLYESSNGDMVDISTISYLKELNPHVIVETKPFTNEIYTEIDLLIQTKLKSIEKYNPVNLNNKCREYNIKYILSINVGLTGYIFVDFGNNHIVMDNNGEKHKSNYIKNIYIQDNKTVLEIYNSKNEFYSGLSFKFTKPSLDTIYNVSTCNQNTITIDEKLDLEGGGDDIQNIHIYEVKSSTKLKHTTLCDRLGSPQYPENVINIDSYDKTMSIMGDIYKLLKKPDIFGKDGMTEVVINKEVEFPIIGCILGSIVAQETIKITGKYTPINQELLLDYSDLYNPDDIYKKCLDKKLVSVYSYLSKSVIRYLKNINIFLIGCGALGCEYLKLFSLLNIATHPKKNITVTDMDNIELSNLNRQFLFRNIDIGKSKSETACKRIGNLNPKMNIRCFTKAVGEENESIFNRSFWENKDIIVNALDNVTARQYVDEKCVLYRKPLFESGTLGTKCNIQIIIPNETKSYSETTDPPEKNIPLCTIKHFPFKIEHCIAWSMEIFNKYFNEFINDLLELSKGTDSFKKYIHKIDNDSVKYEKLELISRFISLGEISLSTIILFTQSIFVDLFMTPINNVLKNHPLDEKLDSGECFWSGNRLPPKYIHPTNQYNPFIICFSKMLCSCIGIHVDISDENIYVDIDYYTQCVNKNIVNEDLYTKNVLLLEHIISSIYVDNKNIDYRLEVFEKDNDDNGHVEIVRQMSNIRANIYNIDEISHLECKLISGNIIPALPTTTSLVTALTLMELLKYVYNKVYSNKLKLQYMDQFINTSINSYIQSEPQKSTNIVTNTYSHVYGCKVQSIPEIFNRWDLIRLNRKTMGIVDINDILLYLKDHYGIEPDMICCGNRILFNKYKINKNIKFQVIYSELNKSKTELIELSISIIDNRGIPIITPKIVYSWYN